MDGRDGKWIIDSTGRRGRVEDFDLHRKPDHLLVRFDNQQVWLPASLVTTREDGSLHIPVDVAAAFAAERDSSQSGHTTVIPVIAEEIQVEKRIHDESLRITKLVQEVQETVDVPLLAEEVEVRRVPVNRPVDTAVAIRHEGDTVIVPLVEEVLTVQKQLFLREEVHIVKKQRETRHLEQVTVRREEVKTEPARGREQ